MAVESSILKTIRKGIGIPGTGYEVFDDELIMDINSVFSILFQLGVGDAPFRITGEDEEWSDFLPDEDKNLEMTKTYIRNKTKLLFDPPTSSFLVELLQKQCAEFESRVSYEVDPGEAE